MTVIWRAALGALLDTSWKPRRIHLLDENELAEGVEHGLVTATVAEATHARAAQVQRELAAGSYAPLHAVRRYLQKAPRPR